MKPYNSKEVIIEKAKYLDLKDIIELYKQYNKNYCFDDIDKFTIDAYYKHVLNNSGNHNLFVLRVSDKIVSTCLFTVIPNLAQALKPNGIIESFVTDEKNRGKGYGKKLIKHVLEMAEDLGCVNVSILVENDSEYIKIYEKIGFQENLKKSLIFKVKG